MELLDESNLEPTANDVNQGNVDGDLLALEAVRKARASGPECGREKTTFDLASKFISKAKSAADDQHRQRRTALFQAINNGDLGVVQSICQESTASGSSLTSAHYRDTDTGASLLIYAFLCSQLEIVGYLISLGDQRLILDEQEVVIHGIKSKRTLLHYIAAKGDVDLARKLLSGINDTGERSRCLLKDTWIKSLGQRPRKLTALHIAAWKGHSDMVKLLIQDFGVDVNLVNNKGDTPILWAVRNGNPGLVKLLLKDMRADDRLENDKGSSPLHWAIRYNYVECVDVLLVYGKSDVNRSRKLGFQFPIMLATALGYVEIVKLLITKGATTDITIKGGDTLLHTASKEGNLDVLKVLMEKRQIVELRDAKNEHGDTPIMQAASHGHGNVVGFLARSGASLTIHNKQGETIWHACVAAQDSEPLAELIKAVIELQMTIVKVTEEGKLEFEQGQTPLHIAAAECDPEKIQAMLQMGCDLSVTDTDGNNMIHTASEIDASDVISQFGSKIDLKVKNKSGDTAMHIACQNGNNASVNSLMALNVSMEVKNARRQTPLHVTAESPKTSVSLLRSLMNYGMKTQNYTLLVEETDEDGNSALHVAATQGRVDFVKELHALSFDQRNNAGNTPLHEALVNRNLEVVHALLGMYRGQARDFNWNHKNKAGDSVLNLAAKYADMSTIQTVIRCGADLHERDRNGNTVLHCLTQASIENPESSHEYVKAFTTVVGSADYWWCMKHLGNIPQDKERVLEYHREAILFLMNKVTNSEGLSVQSMAARKGAHDIMSVILKIPDIYKMPSNVGQTLYDVTYLMPPTMSVTVKHSKGKGQAPVIPYRKAQPSKSCLEYIMDTSKEENAMKIMDLNLFSQFEQSYRKTCFWSYGLLMVVHTAYMLTYSLVGIHHCVESAYGSGPVNPYMLLFFVWPGLQMLHHTIYGLRVFCKQNNRPRTVTTSNKKSVSLTSKVEAHLPLVLAILFAISVGTWLILYQNSTVRQEYVLATSLILGWLLAISFTRGFESVHYFSKMLVFIILKDVLRFFIIYGLVLMAFSFGIHALVSVVPDLRKQYPNPLYTMFLVFNMMIGMQDLFDDGFQDAYDAAGQDSVFTKIVYLIYIGLSTIVLLNLLIAMMNDSYSTILRAQEVSWRLGALELGLDLERMIPFTSKLFNSVTLRQVDVLLPAQGVLEKRWMLVDAQASVEEMDNRDMASGAKAQLEDKVDALAQKMEELHRSLEQVVQRLPQFTSAAN